jgi:hypothetical protein
MVSGSNPLTGSQSLTWETQTGCRLLGVHSAYRATLGQLIDKYGFDVHGHPDRDLEILVHAGLQAQGDLFIIPVDPNRGSQGRPSPDLDLPDSGKLRSWPAVL